MKNNSSLFSTNLRRKNFVTISSGCEIVGMVGLYLFLIVLVVILLFSYTENFTSLATIAGTGTCSTQCIRNSEGVLVNPENCCLCKTSNGYVTGPRNSENPEFRKCMCGLGTGYESYCYKLATNFILSQ